MKMLITARNRENPGVEETAELLKATAEYLEKLSASGNFGVGYMFTNGGGFMIGDLDTAEEVWENLHGHPLYGNFDWTVEPVVETQFVMGHLSGG